ncbi:MAG: gliding motility-associated-like protein [Arenicella sp.]|jgi:gliding motility-associated-like protein
MKKLLFLIMLLNTLNSTIAQNAYIQGDYKFCPDKGVELFAYGDTSYAWANAADPDSIISTDFHFVDMPESVPTYLLYTSTDTLIYTLMDGKSACFCQFYIPNFFSPDGDEFNEKFHPVINCDHFAVRMTIYNREQLIIFDETDYDVSWDGRGPEGQVVQNGVYPYLITFITNEGDKITSEGFVLVGT